jgi:hypothetical protein
MPVALFLRTPHSVDSLAICNAHVGRLYLPRIQLQRRTRLLECASNKKLLVDSLPPRVSRCQKSFVTRLLDFSQLETFIF